MKVTQFLERSGKDMPRIFDERERPTGGFAVGPASRDPVFSPGFPKCFACAL